MDPKKDETTVDTLKRAYTAPESANLPEKNIVHCIRSKICLN